MGNNGGVKGPSLPEEVIRAAKGKPMGTPKPVKIAPQPQAISRIVPGMKVADSAQQKFDRDTFIDILHNDYKIYKANATLGESCKGKCLNSVTCKFSCFLDAAVDTLRWRLDASSPGTIKHSVAERLITADEAKMTEENLKMFIGYIKDFQKGATIES